MHINRLRITVFMARMVCYFNKNPIPRLCKGGNENFQTRLNFTHLLAVQKSLALKGIFYVEALQMFAAITAYITFGRQPDLLI